MSELKQYPVIYEQTVAWGDMDAFGHVIMPCITVMSKVHVWLIWEY